MGKLQVIKITVDTSYHQGLANFSLKVQTNILGFVSQMVSAEINYLTLPPQCEKSHKGCDPLATDPLTPALNHQ